VLCIIQAASTDAGCLYSIVINVVAATDNHINTTKFFLKYCFDKSNYLFCKGIIYTRLFYFFYDELRVQILFKKNKKHEKICEVEHWC